MRAPLPCLGGGRAAGFALALLGAVFLIIGIGRGEMGIVLAKAARICLECIGIG